MIDVIDNDEVSRVRKYIRYDAVERSSKLQQAVNLLQHLCGA